MARRSDNSPVGQTCPKIDSVISMVHSVYMSSEEMSRAEYTEFEEIMEKIRSANSELREWGNEQYYRADELESDLDNAQREIINLESEIESLKSQIKELENELQQL